MVSKRSYVLIVKEKGESKNLSSRFSLFDSGAVRYLFHLRLKYPRIIMLSARLLNQINKILETELETYPSSFAISK